MRLRQMTGLALAWMMAVAVLGAQPPGALDRLLPPSLVDFPRLPESGGITRPQGLHPLGIPSIELRLDERSHVDPVDGHVEDLAGDVDVVDVDASHAHLVEGTPAELCVPDVDGAEPAPRQVDAIEARARQTHVLELRTRHISVAKPLHPFSEGQSQLGKDFRQHNHVQAKGALHHAGGCTRSRHCKNSCHEIRIEARRRRTRGDGDVAGDRRRGG